MHPDYEYDPDLHTLATEIARGEGHLPHNEGIIIAEAYLDLLERRGLPPKLKCRPQIQLQSGGFYDFLEPHKTPIDPQDIAAALSKLCRCTGHILSDDIYSIAQHCCHAADAAPQHLKFKALMHDAPESVLGDVATPLKQLLVDYKIIETRVTTAFANQFYLPHDFETEVKEIDIRMAATEKRDIMPAGEWEMLKGIEPYDFKIIPWSPFRARTEWLFRFDKLYEEYMDARVEATR